MSKKTYLNWSSGKDASMALHLLQLENAYSVDLLLTSVNGHHNRVSMHGLRRELLERQVKALGIKMETIELPEEPTMEQYSQIMEGKVGELKTKGFEYSAFGDIFLEDLKKYRKEQLDKLSMKSVFPLWKRDTKELLQEFLRNGFKAIVVTVNAKLLDKSFAGRIIDENFISDLPDNVDPCGENGEFHTFCFDGPIFKCPVEFKVGEKVYREYNSPNGKEGEKIGFWYCDLV